MTLARKTTDAESEKPELSQHDLDRVAQLERQLQIIRDRTISVVYNYATAVYITGRPGTGKTHTVSSELAKYKLPWLLHNARLTAMGLFELLREHPEHVAVLDDIPSIFRDKMALQILLAALDGAPNEPRTIRYKSKDKDEAFDYSGRLILIGNVPLSHDPLAQAVASRVQLLQHDPSDDVLAAYIKYLSQVGYEELSPSECWTVANFVIQETRASGLRLDLRHFFKALEDFRQCRAGHAETPWQVLVRSSLQKSVRDFIRPLTKAEDIERQREVARAVCEEFPNDCKRQQEEFISRTGFGKSVFHERKRELKHLGLIHRRSA